MPQVADQIIPAAAEIIVAIASCLAVAQQPTCLGQGRHAPNIRPAHIFPIANLVHNLVRTRIKIDSRC